MGRKVAIDGASLTIEQVDRVARRGAQVALSATGRRRVTRCRAALEKLIARGETIYGVTAGFGEFADRGISSELGSELQKRLVRSHAAGFGDAQPVDAVRAAILCRANMLAKGHSGLRLEVLETFIELLNRGVTPFVYEKGSVGASGDLSPLSQVAQVMMGEGEAFFSGELIPGALALKKAGLEPVTLSFKEGLSLINGSQMMAGELALRCVDTERLLKNAIVASAMTMDALTGATESLEARIHELRPFPGQIATARSIRRLLEGSMILAASSGGRQNAYSLRCIPQILGPSLDALHYVEQQLSIEINSADDNPLLFPREREHLSGGNFHGQAIAMAADFLAIALSEVANLSERHTNRLLNAALSGLPGYLTKNAGLNSGLMGAQFTAAALVSENKVLSHPGVVDSISVSGDQEDHVSMGPVSVRKLKEICRNVTGAIAIEMLCAAQALDLRRPKRPGIGVRSAYRQIRKSVDRLEDDRPLYPDIAKIAELVGCGSIVAAVERKVGPIDLDACAR